MRTTLALPFLALLAVGCGSSTVAAPTTTGAPKATIQAPSPGLPKVSGAPNALPVLDIPKSDPPAKLAISVITPGTGAEVKAGQKIKVQYLGEIWATSAKFDASWDRGQPIEFGIGTHQVIAGWDEGLVGQKIGSRVLLVIPPDKGYGAKGYPPVIKGTDTLVFVVDIIDSK